MGNRPRCCCDEVLGIKKGPWTPEEDHLLASYIKQHGPANWRSVPTNAGLLRCSKSCRLRWTNYLRPEIKRGNFTELEEKMIISLQSLWGNKWAAMASHLPQRTDNDIKNYWNTDLKKKLMKKFHSHHLGSSSPNFQFLNKDYSSISFNRTRNLECNHNLDIHQTSALNKFINSITSSSTSTPSSTTYALSRLLEGWEDKVVPNGSNNSDNNNHNTSNNNLDDDDIFIKKVEEQETRNDDDAHLSNEADYFESLLTFENTSNVACWEQKSSPQSTKIHGTTSASSEEAQTTTTTTTTTTTIEDMVDSILLSDHQGLIEDDQNEPPFSVLEKWLLDEATQQVLEEDHMEECSNGLSCGAM
ncbi:hypothetical protein C5167_017775 [Papaver somniferum]|uniref:Uncharacterized protein n=1 Tax=Papaver somniferum TaxID=3469 RepID=A0A4Y7IPD1_PAPSO|nr:hypothetical protein C5167_017775 [Papaver somniferum]